MSAWTIDYDEFDPSDEPKREALCALGNGYLVTRGADETQRAHAHDTHYPGTYLAGGYNRAVTRIAGESIENEDLVNFPNWLFMTFRCDGGEWFDLHRVEVLGFSQALDLRSALLRRAIRFRDGQGRTTSFRSERLVSMPAQHLAAIRWELTPEDWSGHIEVRSEIDGRVTNSGVQRYRELEGHHLDVISCACGHGPDEPATLLCRTKQSRLEVAFAARLSCDGHDAEERLAIELGDRAGELLTVKARRGEPIRLTKTVAVFTERDHAISEPMLEATNAARRAPDFDTMAKDQEREWHRLWDRFDVAIEGDCFLNIVRLHIFHLLQTVSPHVSDLDVGVPARGWHGEAYRGHIFWDELFIFPLLSLRLPELTRSLLMYRYRRLGAARLAAAGEGYRGARFPWQSGSNGREESQTLHLNPRSGRWNPDNSQQQRHINIAIGYNAWYYFQCTGDLSFLGGVGATLMIEATRYLANRAEYDEDDRRYHIRGIMGPDEFHESYPDAEEPGLDDNAYTNVMTSWLLTKTLEALERIPPDVRDELCEDLGLTDAELERWPDVSRRLFVPVSDDGLIEQFAGFTDLEELDWDAYRAEHGDIQRLDRILESENDSVNRYQATKQADVLMLFYLLSTEELRECFERLGYDFTPEWITRNIEYYAKRTSHGSTLSQVVHSWVLAHHDPDRSRDLFMQALRSDIDDIQGGTTHEGIHLGAMAGTIDLLHRCYCGITVRDDAIHFAPAVPEEIGELRLRVVYRAVTLRIRASPKELLLDVPECRQNPIEVRVFDESITIGPGEQRRFDLRVDATT